LVLIDHSWPVARVHLGQCCTFIMQQLFKLRLKHLLSVVLHGQIQWHFSCNTLLLKLIVFLCYWN